MGPWEGRGGSDELNQAFKCPGPESRGKQNGCGVLKYSHNVNCKEPGMTPRAPVAV